jgi:hypothetical protein
MDLINIALTNEEAFALRTLLYTEICGEDMGPRGTLDKIERKLNAAGVGHGTLKHRPVGGHVYLESLTH